jgi:hypothetical protein
MKDYEWMKYARFDVLRSLRVILIKYAENRKYFMNHDFIDRASKKIENILLQASLNFFIYSNLETVESRLLVLYHTRKLFNNKRSDETILKYNDELFEYILDMDENYLFDLEAEDYNCLL